MLWLRNFLMFRAIYWYSQIIFVYLKKMNTVKKEIIRINETQLREMVAEEVERTVLEMRENLSERKEKFRLLHEKASTENEDVMNRYYDIPTNQNKPVRIDEITIDRLLNKHGKDGLINISANRSDMPQEYNIANTKNLISDLKNSGYSYLPTYGGYRGKDGVEDSYEPSFVVFNYTTNGEKQDFNKLRQFAMYLCGKYNQDSVLIKAPDKNPIYIDCNGKKTNKTESNVVWKNDPKQKYFTSLKPQNEVDEEIRSKLMGQYKTYCHKNNIPITKSGFENFYNTHLKDIKTIGKRYTYDIRFEGRYVNPMPCTLTERMKRKGEIMVWE